MFFCLKVLKKAKSMKGVSIGILSLALAGLPAQDQGDCRFRKRSDILYTCKALRKIFVCLRSRIGCYVTVFQNISNLRDVFYKEMSLVSYDTGLFISSNSYRYCEVNDVVKTVYWGARVDLFVQVALCFAAEQRALQCDEETGDPALGKSFHHQGSEQVRHCVS